MASASDDFSGTLGNWTQDTGTWSIVSGGCREATAGADNYKMRYTATAPATNDYYSEADLTMGGLGGDQGPGLGVRLANGTGDANTDGYSYQFYDSDFSYLMELTNSADAILATGGSTGASTTYTNCRLEANGTTLTGTRNGAADVNASDATYASGGWGLIWGDFGGTVTALIDNWSAADLSAGGAVGPLIGGKLANHSILQGRLIG